MKSIFKVKNVYKTYVHFNSKTHALNNVSLDIKEGNVVVILGPSGSGKSTLLNILSGIDSITKGRVYFFDKRIDNYTIKENTLYRKDNVGFIFQSYNLIANLTIRENIEISSRLSKDSFDLDEIIDIVDLSSHKDKFPYQLSGGQLQRVAIARAIVKKPKILFCDEPTGALDEKVGKKILALLQDINKKYGATIVIVTHNPSIGNLGNVVFKMNSGEIVETKINKNVLDAEKVEWA